MSKAVIITGATGNQGGALITALLEANADFEIIAVSRNPSSSSAQRLAQKSPKIKVISGNLEQPNEIFEAAKKVTSALIWGVYSVQSPMSMNPWDEPEVRQGKALIDAALKNNVEMFVYSSVDRGGDASFDSPTQVPHFRTKHEIEHYLVDSTKGTNMSYTILRPVAFMNNLQPGFIGKAFSTIWDMSLGAKPLQLVATSDIGFFAAQAFMTPDKYRNRALSLAGDELSFEQFAEVYQQKTGEVLPTTYHFVAWLLLCLSKDMSMMFTWFRTHGYAVDIKGLRKVHPGLKTFAGWLEEESPFVERK